VVNAVVLVATGVNADGHREILGLKVATSETGAAWNTFFADLVARGLSSGPEGVMLVTSDAHAGLVEAIAANLPGAAWQRCRTHYAANLMSVCPKASWGWVKALLHSVYDQPDAEAVHAQYDRISTPWLTSCPTWPTTSTKLARTCSRSPRSPRRSGARSGPTTPTSASTARSAGGLTWSGSSPTGTR
jgi:putative transposase